ncbi:cytochrome P450 9e2-like [Hetaerina americana]|uniref:cytochrome P450 9e2-like n=1 Tax=Hetaerina americana TaxID=62018 RepID=UPI003A7F25EC
MASLLWILGDWRFILSLAAVLIGLLYIYTTKNFDYWKKRGIPEVKIRPIPFFGHTWKVMLGLKSFNEGFSDVYNSLGDEPYGGFMQSINPAIMIKDPELIKHILVKDSIIFLERAFHTNEENDPLNGKGLFNLRGRKWKEMRTRISPTFTSGRMKAMLPLILNCGDEMTNFLKNRIEKGEDIVEIKDLTSGYTMAVIAACAFGINLDSVRNPESSEFRRMGKLLFKPTWKRSIMLMFFFIAPKIMEVLGIRFTMDETAVFFRRFVKNLVEAREKALDEEERLGVKTKHLGDFIHHLVLIKRGGLSFLKDERDENEGEPQLDFEGDQSSLSTIDLDDITAQVMAFFSAGFEASSALLSFAMYELSSSENGKRLQKELREEIRNVMKECGGKITYDGIKKMHLLDRILCETLRIYPPAGLLSRRNTKEYKIPGTDYVLEPFTQIFIPTQDMQHDPKYFPDPKRFDPDRFLPDNIRESVGQYRYIPFGDGPRHCIGQRFAELQARIGMIVLIANFDFEVCREKTSVPLKFAKRAFILTAATGIWLRVKPVVD